ncbi:hypothetical protein GGI11_001119, partial [Coemansia sp. RSA 2049]
MSPLTIGGIEGLTDQQAAEVVELLTPFLSPTATPLVRGMVPQHAVGAGTFSPLTSPALMSQQQQQQQQQFAQFQLSQSIADTISMPPPSLSTTAEHIMRHYLLESLAASLQNTPHLQFTTSGFSSATNVFAGLNLPDSLLATASNDASNGNNGHGNGNNNHPLADFTIPEPSKGTQKQDTRTLHQLNDVQPITATPASLLNLPASAHHLPHTSTGEIVNPQSIASLPVVQQHQQQQQQHQPMENSTMEQHALPAFLMHSAPMPSEFLHPPAPPPLQIEEASIIATTSNNASGKNDNTSGIKKRGGRRKSMTATTDRLQQQQQTVGNKVATKPRRNEATRRRSRQALLSPRTTPLVPSTLKAGTSPGISPALAPLTPS